MQHRWMSWSCIVVTTLALSTGLFAQSSSQPGGSKSTPDVSGIWQQVPGKSQLRFTDAAPLQPKYMQIFKDNRGYPPSTDGSGVNGLDPEMYCMPDGVPRMWTTPSPFEIVQVPGRIYIIHQSLQQPLTRYIYTDGRDHPKGYPPSFMGHSIGRWDGDTLVVDTIGLDGITWMDTYGTPHSDALHVVERIRRTAKESLEVEFQFDDSQAFTHSWTAKKTYKLYPDWQMMPGLTCEDRFRVDFENKVLLDKKEWIERRDTK